MRLRPALGLALAGLRRAGWKSWARLLFGLAVLAWLVARTSPEGIAAALASARPLPALAALAAALAAQGVVARRLRTFAATVGLDLPTRRVLGINLAAAFYALFVPGGNVTAGAVRLYRLSRIEGGGAAGALSAILRDRLDATAGLVAVGLFFLLLGRPSGSPVTPLLAGAALLCGGLIAALALFSQEGRVPFGSRGDHLPWSLRRMFGELGRVAAETGRMPPRRQAAAFLLSLAAQLLGVLAYVLLARSMGLDVTVATMGWVRSGVILLTMIPVSVGGVGVREGAFLVLLAGHGIAEEAILAFSLLVFTVTVLGVAGIGGVLEALRALSGGCGGLRRPGADGP